MSSESATRPRRVRSVADLRRTRIEPGDLAFRGDDTRAIYVVVGTLSNDDLEAVSVAQLAEKTIRVDGYDDVLEAVAGGRAISYRFGRDELTPWPDAIDTPDIKEVRR